MITPRHFPKGLILLLASCLVWIGLLLVASMICTSIATGWIVGGAVILALTVWLLVMLREIREVVSFRVASLFRLTER